MKYNVGRDHVCYVADIYRDREGLADVCADHGWVDGEGCWACGVYEERWGFGYYHHC